MIGAIPAYASPAFSAAPFHVELVVPGEVVVADVAVTNTGDTRRQVTDRLKRAEDDLCIHVDFRTARPSGSVTWCSCAVCRITKRDDRRAAGDDPIPLQAATGEPCSCAVWHRFAEAYQTGP